MDNDRASVAGALDHLVNQFSDPLSFLRELIQNSLDAGSLEVEVWFELQQGDGDQHTMIIHVDDFGEGMDREIIDTRLTRLFSSSKDGDLTKIGRFGIGFASVFALDPDAVCVDTSRGGETWRVLFRKDRSFVLIERDEPVEGTKIQVIKAVTKNDYASIQQRALEVVSYWCKHVEAEIRFDGERINQPIDLDVPVKVSREDQGTLVVAGYTRDGSRFGGFYNKGLTLLETSSGYYPNIAFKVSSRYLEHTLTRDNVLHDENYEKAMSVVDDLIDVALIERLFEKLDDVITTNEERTEEETYLQRLVAWNIENDISFPPSTWQRAILRKVNDVPVTLSACLEAAKASTEDRLGMLLKASRNSPLTEALATEGFLIAHEKRAPSELLDALGGGKKVPVAHTLYCAPAVVGETKELSSFEPLQAATMSLLRKAGIKVASLELGHFNYPGSGIESWTAMSQRKLGEVTLREEARKLNRALLSRKRVLVVNADHPTVDKLIELASKEPEFAAYTLAKLFFLGHQLDTQLDTELATISVERRCRRLTS